MKASICFCLSFLAIDMAYTNNNSAKAFPMSYTTVLSRTASNALFVSRGNYGDRRGKPTQPFGSDPSFEGFRPMVDPRNPVSAQRAPEKVPKQPPQRPANRFTWQSLKEEKRAQEQRQQEQRQQQQQQQQQQERDRAGSYEPPGMQAPPPPDSFPGKAVYYDKKIGRGKRSGHLYRPLEQAKVDRRVLGRSNPPPYYDTNGELNSKREHNTVGNYQKLGWTSVGKKTPKSLKRVGEDPAKRRLEQDYEFYSKGEVTRRSTPTSYYNHNGNINQNLEQPRASSYARLGWKVQGPRQKPSQSMLRKDDDSYPRGRLEEGGASDMKNTEDWAKSMLFEEEEGELYRSLQKDYAISFENEDENSSQKPAYSSDENTNEFEEEPNYISKKEEEDIQSFPSLVDEINQYGKVEVQETPTMLYDQHTSDIQLAMKNLSKTIDNLYKQTYHSVDALTNLQNNIDDLEDCYQDKITELESKYLERMNEIEQNNKKETEELKRKYQKEFYKLSARLKLLENNMTDAKADL